MGVKTKKKKTLNEEMKPPQGGGGYRHVYIQRETKRGSTPAHSLLQEKVVGRVNVVVLGEVCFFFFGGGGDTMASLCNALTALRDKNLCKPFPPPWTELNYIQQKKKKKYFE